MAAMHYGGHVFVCFVGVTKYFANSLAARCTESRPLVNDAYTLHLYSK